jgi:hypothetical protein
MVQQLEQAQLRRRFLTLVFMRKERPAQLTTSVWPPGTEPESREGLRGKRGPTRTVYHDGVHSPVSVAELSSHDWPRTLPADTSL